ncbi:ABC transporter permease, partial [Frankia sp. Cr1]|uniref:ABC transporter permease n=1 Tax=Frankia sp. Cr1 TaxID=3073931 RepID=UPI002AD48885
MNVVTLDQPATRTASLSPTVALGDIAGIARRNLVRLVRTPQLLVISSAQPLLILLLFRYVLGGAIAVPGGSYVNYIVPAIFVEASLIGGAATSVGLAEDLKSGIIDRFRALPMARSAVLAGRTVADLCRAVVVLAMMIAVGIMVGFRFHNSVPAIISGLGLVLLFGYAMSWVFASIGLAVKDPETAQVAAILPFFLLVFPSSAFVPVSTMPGWLQGYATVQPANVTINAVRALMEGGPALHWVWQSVVWSVGIGAVFAPLAVHQYRNLTS